MNTLTLSHPANVEILVDTERGNEPQVDVNEATFEDSIEEVLLNGMSFRVLVLQRNWVEDVITYISEVDLCSMLGGDKFQMLYIKEKIKEKGVCRFRKRIGFFKYLVYEIRDWWDYDSGL